MSRRARKPNAHGASSATPARTASPYTRGTGRLGWQRWWPPAAIAAAALAAYVNALHNPFIFDDASTIVGNGTIRDIGTSLGGGPTQLATAGRPVANLSFAINFALGGVAPFGYHVGNLLIVVLCGWLLYGVTRRLLSLPRLSDIAGTHANGVAAAVALLWTVHPLNTEVVNYVTQRTESLMALAYLGAVYAAVRAMASDRPTSWYVVSVLSCAAGMACKESMVTAPVAILLIDAVLVSDSVAHAIRKRPFYYAALAMTWIVLAVLIVEGPRFRSAGFSSGVDPWTYLLNQAPMLLRYMRLVVLPFGLVLDYGLPHPVTLADVVVPGLIVVGLLVVTLAAWRWTPRAALAATLVFLLLAPTSSVLPIATEVGAERRMFLPLAVVLILIVSVVWRWLRARRQQRAAIALGLVLGGLWFALTVRRNAEYHSEVGLWQTVVERWPQGRAHYNLGIALKAAGRRSEAIDEYRKALPDTPEAHYALGFELQADGRYDEAIEQYRAFVSQKPLDIEVPRAYHQIGRALIAVGKPDDAVAAFREALARNPGHADSLAGLADTLLAQGKLDEAATAFRNLLARNPNRPDAMMNLGLTLVRLDRDAEARDIFAQVVQLQPNDVAAHVNLAYALANTGRYGEAVREFRRAAELERDPAGRAEIQAALGELLGAH